MFAIAPASWASHAGTRHVAGCRRALGASGARAGSVQASGVRLSRQRRGARPARASRARASRSPGAPSDGAGLRRASSEATRRGAERHASTSDAPAAPVSSCAQRAQVASWHVDASLGGFSRRSPARTSRGAEPPRPASPARLCAARPAGRPQRARPARTSPETRPRGRRAPRRGSGPPAARLTSLPRGRFCETGAPAIACLDGFLRSMRDRVHLVAFC